MFVARRRQSKKAQINKEITGWPKGYRRNDASGYIPEDALSDLTNADMTLDALPYVRAGLKLYGSDMLGTCIGLGTFYKNLADGSQENYEISAQVITGVTKICIRKDGGTWTQIAGSYTFDTSAWVDFTHSNNRVYITNGKQKISYYDISAGTIGTYTLINTPSQPTCSPTGLTGTNYTYYYAITFGSESGETDASPTRTQQVSTTRDNWDGTTKYVDISWTLPATHPKTVYIYAGISATDLRLVATVSGDSTTFRDDGRAQTIDKTPPLVNSTDGPTLTYGIDILGQFFGWGDINNPELVWYDGGGTDPSYSGNFTVSGGGGYIGLGTGVPMAVAPYHTGKGDPMPTVLPSLGSPQHLQFTPETIGDLTALMPSWLPANGDAPCVSPLAVVSAGNAIHYPTPQNFSYEGNAPNIPNILSANSSSDFIQDDYDQLTQSAMKGARATYFKDRIYFAVPRLSTSNNEIWVLDLRPTPARWVMPWLINVEHIYKYKDNSQVERLLLLVNNQVVEFDSTAASADLGVPFRTRVASGPIRFDSVGITESYIQTHRFKILNPRGYSDYKVTAKIPGKPDDNFKEFLDLPTNSIETGIGEGDIGVAQFGDEPQSASTDLPDAKAVAIDVKSKVSELTWEVTSTKAGVRYSVGGTHEEGVEIPKAYANA